MCAAVALLGAEACQEQTSPRLTPLKPPGPHRGYVESSSVVLPPGANGTCANGRAVFTYGSFSGLKQHVMSVPLGQLLQDQNEPIGAASLYIDTPMPGDTTDTVPTHGSLIDVVCYGVGGTDCVGFCGNFTQTHPRYARSDSDTWMVRIPGGGILYVGLAARYDTQALVLCADPLSCNCDVGPAQTTFGALLVYDSYDCGRTWHVLSHIDPTDIPDAGYQGFDREAMYYDHFTGNVYVTVAAAAANGNPPKNTLVYRSEDLGKTWANETAPGLLPSIHPPNNMTSTRQDLYIARCEAGHDPELWLSPDGQHFGMLRGVHFPVPCGNVHSGDVMGYLKLVYPGVTLARGPSPDYSGLAQDQIRVAYPAIENGTVGGATFKRSVLHVVNVTIPHDLASGNPTVQPLATIRPREVDASAIQARFIETDRFEFTPPPLGSNGAGLENAAALYWLEVPSSHNPFPLFAGETARWAAFVGSTMYGPSPLAVKNEAPVHWVPNVGGQPDHAGWAGDYDVGAFFVLPLARPVAFFLAEWPQSDQPAPAPPNAYLHYNIMALESLQ